MAILQLCLPKVMIITMMVSVMHNPTYLHFIPYLHTYVIPKLHNQQDIGAAARMVDL